MARSGHFKVTKEGHIVTNLKWAARKYKVVDWYRCDRDDSKGYRYVSYKQARPKAHRLAYRLYHGCLDSELEIEHANSDGCDNSKENLRLVTSRENSQLAFIKGENRSKLTVAEVKIIKRRLKKNGQYYGFITDTAREFGVSMGTIQALVRNKTWKWVKV